MLVQDFLVLIKRGDFEKIPKVIYFPEIAIYQDRFGEGSVFYDPEKTAGVGPQGKPYEIDHDELFDKLEKVHGEDVEQSWGKRREGRMEIQCNKRFGKNAKEPEKKEEDKIEESEEMAKARSDYGEMTVDQLREICQEMKLKGWAKAKPKTLVKKIMEARFPVPEEES